MEVPDAAVACVWRTREQLAPFELVDDRDHPAGGDVQPLGERVLRLAFVRRDRSEEGELAGLELQRPEHLVEAPRDRVAEAREQEGDAPERRRRRLGDFRVARAHTDMVQLPNDLAMHDS